MKNEELKFAFIKMLKESYNISEEIEKEIIAKALVRKIPPNNIITNEGDSCTYFTFVITGSVRVYKLSETGKEITLYRIEEGESCILTASCILSLKKFPAISLTESEVTALLIPSDVFLSWVNAYPFWRNYVYDLMAKRISAIITIVEEIAFKRIDRRLTEFLVRSFDKEPVLHMTHAFIASELGTAREVISRLLKDFENHGVVELSRGKIKLLDMKMLKNFSVHHNY